MASAFLTRAACGLLVLFALVLPFEARLFRLGPLQITTVECVLYALLAVWGLEVLASAARDPCGVLGWLTRLRDEGTSVAVLLWTITLFVSAVAAPSYRLAAFKFSLRSLSGVLCFFAVRSLARDSAIRRRVILALLAGALLSAATAIAEAKFPETAVLWNHFREGSGFDTLGLPRPSGVFEFPTIGAMYWEATVPIVVAAPFFRVDRCTPRAAALDHSLALLGSGVLITAVVLSATRSGIAGIGVSTFTLLALGWRSGTRVRGVVAGVLGVLVAVVGISVLAGDSRSLLRQRLMWWRDDTWLRADYAVGRAPSTVRMGEAFTVPIRLRNAGTLAWPSGGPKQVRLGYHWEARSPGAVSEYEGIRTDLAADVPPGEDIEVFGKVRGPAADGAYRLRWDLVQDGVAWFGEIGNAMPEQAIEVAGAANGAESIATHTPPPRVAPRPPSRQACWSAAITLWRGRPLFGVGADNFRRTYEAVLSPAPDGLPYTDTRIHANSLYFETLADQGLLGIAGLAGLTAALIVLARRYWLAGCVAGLGCFTAVGTFFVHGLLDYFFEFTSLFGLFWLLCGLAVTLDPQRSAERSWDNQAPELVPTRATTMAPG